MNGIEGLAVIKRTRVEAMTGLSRATIYRRMGDGTFPRAIRLGLKAVAWRASEIEAWLRDPADWRAPDAVASGAKSQPRELRGDVWSN
ncbi:helix-turn-helix transcriptional regulator [Burkholderia sp. BCC1988]|uniref:helix-turn-helix transcriptional regulator n=1 Tax=Burkholderia sp. BCC1988 TaxID=2817443 RepID=UPI002AB210AE|nr:AlpA family phage regulatory protein [Burkholderia sp. BCC1988]